MQPKQKIIRKKNPGAEVKVAGSCQWIFHCFSVGVSMGFPAPAHPVSLCVCVSVCALKLQIAFCGFSRIRSGENAVFRLAARNKKAECLIKLPETDQKSNNETMETTIMVCGGESENFD